MNVSLEQFLTLDLAPMLTAAGSAIACALLGTFLLLRRQALMGDAIAHAILPGLAAGFLLTGSRGTLPMFLGALSAGVVTAVMVETLRRQRRVEPGAAMGVVFSVMFALGVVLMSLPSTRQVDLDADCVLSGVLETISWLGDPKAGHVAPTTLASLLDPRVLAGMPRELMTAWGVCGLVVVVVIVFFKELRLSSFDPALAAALGFRPAIVNLVLMVLVALASVASFEAVGSILVVAMLIAPPASARLLSDRLAGQLAWSGCIAGACSIVGYLLAAFGAPAAGLGGSVSASGMIAVMAGVVLTGAIIFAPERGLIARAVRTLALSVGVAREDLLAMLYRIEELGPDAPAISTRHAVRGVSASGLLAALSALGLSRRHGEIRTGPSGVRLTDTGRDRARRIVRTHRLWELYLVKELGLRPDHVHPTADRLQHVTSPVMSSTLESALSPAASDPHGRALPGGSTNVSTTLAESPDR